MSGFNLNPIIHTTSTVTRSDEDTLPQEDIEEDSKGESRDPIDSLEVFDLLRNINDPEHPLTLEQLNVVKLDLIEVNDKASTLSVNFTPTIPHCSMATLIGLCLRVKLLRSVAKRFKVSVKITPGTHASEDEINKQLNDKERVIAALENAPLLEVVNKCVAQSDVAISSKPVTQALTSSNSERLPPFLKGQS